MSTKTVVKRAGALQSLSDGLLIENGELVLTPALLEGMRIAEALQSEIDAFYGSIKMFLEVNECKGGESELGYVKLNSQSRYTITGKVAPRFLRDAVDTEEVKHWKKNHKGALPKGIKEVTFKRLNKKVKEQK